MQRAKTPRFPQALVEERRVEPPVGREGEAVGPGLRVDLQAPGQVGGAAVKLLVGPVAPAADCLGDDDARAEDIEQGGETYVVASCPPAGAEGAGGDRAPDAEAAVPDVQRLEAVAAGAEVALPVGGNTVEPRADDAERYGSDGEVLHVTGAVTTSLPASLLKSDGRDDSEKDAERVARIGIGLSHQTPEEGLEATARVTGGPLRG